MTFWFWSFFGPFLRHQGSKNGLIQKSCNNQKSVFWATNGKGLYVSTPPFILYALLCIISFVILASLFPWVQIAYKCGIKSACLYNTGRFPSVILCSTSFWHLYSGFCKQRIIPLIIACRAQCHTSTTVQKQKSILVTYV